MALRDTKLNAVYANKEEYGSFDQPISVYIRSIKGELNKLWATNISCKPKMCFESIEGKDEFVKPSNVEIAECDKPRICTETIDNFSMMI